MDIKDIETAIEEFVGKHQAAINMADMKGPKIFELGAFVGVAERYRLYGYDVSIKNLMQGNFVAKTSTRGNLLGYSWICLEKKGKIRAELHMNLNVRSAHDEGVYCVDVGIVKPGKVFKKKHGKKQFRLKNEDLISFVEAKKAQASPMVLASFIGMVHEIKPEFIYRKFHGKFIEDKHLIPCLICVKGLSPNSQTIVRGHHRRNFKVCVWTYFDAYLKEVVYCEDTKKLKGETE